MAPTRYPLDAYDYERLLDEVRTKGTAYGASPFGGRHLTLSWQYTVDYVCSGRELARLENEQKRKDG